MRCKNCGWPNKPNEKTCVKCHAPLEKNDFDSTLSPDMGNDNEIYGKTVREEDVFYHKEFEPEPIQATEESGNTRPCPKCGYPVRPGTDKCPNCKFPLNGNAVHSDYKRTRMDTEPENRKPTRMNTNTAGNFHKGTVNPYMMNLELEPSFALKPIKRINERHELEELEFEGKEIVLNRENTEANNPSITSRQQAVISNVNGHWYIEDKSGQKTTFVQAAAKIELHEGDLILLGNRLFEFHE
ncbi:MAG TPA: zinc ribbon domain-containing protein [Candidatus Phocaeicola excrementigallinarum]|nr:zinc ribbon domain-containing protein [Candidatus Phocaeicola excrementigallinarum]